MYNVYITGIDDNTNIPKVKGYTKVTKVIVYTYLITLHHPNNITETITFNKILKVEIVDQTFDNEEYEQERG